MIILNSRDWLEKMASEIYMPPKPTLD